MKLCKTIFCMPYVFFRGVQTREHKRSLDLQHRTEELYGYDNKRTKYWNDARLQTRSSRIDFNSESSVNFYIS